MDSSGNIIEAEGIVSRKITIHEDIFVHRRYIIEMTKISCT